MTDKKEKIVSRQALYDEIWTDSAQKVAQRYETDYSRFLKICKDNDIPVPPSGYWTKLAFNKPVQKTPLPDSEIEMVQLDPERGTKKEAGKDTSAEDNPVFEEDKIGLKTNGEGESSKFNRETLYQEVWESPVTHVAKRYKMSSASLRTICKKLDIPLPTAGYWSKLRAGKEVSKPDLPKLEATRNEDKPKSTESCSLHINKSALSFLKEDVRRKVIEAASKLRVPDTGVRLHKDIAVQKERCEKWLRQQNDGTLRYGSQTGEKPLLVDCISPKSYSRAFHILDVLLKGMLPFGVSVKKLFHFQINGEDVPFRMSEARDQIPHEVTDDEKMQLLRYEEEKRKYSWASKPNIRKWDHPWNGRLTLIINGKYRFTDRNSRVLEDRVGDIMIAFYESSDEVRLERLEKEEKERKEAEKRRKAAEFRARYNHEIDRTEGLVNAANDYATACKIRAYIEAVKSSGCKSTDWIEWAKAKADWYDPTICAEDAYFGIRKHNKNPDEKTPQKKYHDGNMHTWLSHF